MFRFVERTFAPDERRLVTDHATIGGSLRASVGDGRAFVFLDMASTIAGAFDVKSGADDDQVALLDASTVGSLNGEARRRRRYGQRREREHGAREARRADRRGQGHRQSATSR